MAKSTLTNIPSITLPDCIIELQLINVNLFELKQGVKTLIEMIENDMDNSKLKKVIEIYRMKDVLDNLNPKD